MDPSRSSTASPGRRRWPALAGPPKNVQQLSAQASQPPDGLLSPAGSKFSSQLRGLPSVSRSESAPQLASRPGSGARLEPLASRPSTSLDATASRRQQLWSRSAQNFERKVSKDFKSKHQDEVLRQEMEKSVLKLALSQAPVPLDQGLSYSARYQNFQKEQYSMQFEMLGGHAPGSPGGGSLRAEAAAAAAAEMEARDGILDKDEFIKNVALLDNQIQDMSRSIQFNHLEKNTASERQRERAEEARRQKEAELRRLRKKEQMARDPKRKVALRIQNQRREAALQPLEVDKSKRDLLPMRNYEVHSLSGSSKIPIVDVLAIQNQCAFLGEGQNVTQMLEVREREEKFHFAPTSQGDSVHDSHSAWADTSSSTCLYDLSFEERHERAVAAKENYHAQCMLDKMSVMRSQWNYQLPFTVDGDKRSAKSSKALAKQLSEKIGLKMKSGGRRGSVLGALSMLSALGGYDDDLPTPRTLEKQRLLEAARAKKQMEAQRELSMAQKLRVRRRWAIVKAAVKWLRLLIQTSRRHRQADICVAVLRQMGEWARIKKSMGYMFSCVSLLQQTVRAFLCLQRTRVAAIEKEWNRVENRHLSVYFRNVAVAMVKETKVLSEDISKKDKDGKGAKYLTKREKHQLETLKMLEGGVEDGDIRIDYMKYKIPAAERILVCQKWYNKQLRKHVRTQSHIVTTFKQTLAAERELSAFLTSFGVENSKPSLGDVMEKEPKDKRKSRQGAHGSKSVSYWYEISEDTLVKAIAICAQGMAHIAPFGDHPANRDKDDRAEVPKLDGKVAPKVFAAAVLKATERPCSLGHFATPVHSTATLGTGDDGALAERSKQATVADAGAGTADIEDVFKDFTPRLRDIREKQLEEYRSRRDQRDDG
eukprot:TRINITY_DN18288_c0_g1_i1.p1 TRINITY_DN18288_c0_g1~~TRINITY_DN18288_c0_g1_i1.p1  ORF type:complete len:878 (+),score=185.02 TRINITY_DN18288_c0_g1_i1:45-2678(+)